MTRMISPFASSKGGPILILAVLLLFAANLHAQGSQGSLAGEVTDNLGARIGGASVTIENQDTGAT